jgi:hypothetical protein
MDADERGSWSVDGQPEHGPLGDGWPEQGHPRMHADSRGDIWVATSNPAGDVISVLGICVHGIFEKPFTAATR